MFISHLFCWNGDNPVIGRKEEKKGVSLVAGVPYSNVCSERDINAER
jgi:hypothetical protein